METEEIYSVSISALTVGKFITRWAEDNHISILTERGIYIFELIPSPLSPYASLKFTRSFIYPPSVIPGESLSTSAKEWIWGCEREDLYSLLMDRNLTPKMEEVTDTVPTIVDAVWSPQNLLFSNKCLLAVLTSAGAVFMLYKLANQWYSAYDLTSMYSEGKAQSYPNAQKEETEYSSVADFKNRMNSLQAVAIGWSQIFDDFAYFAVIFRKGNTAIYKIPKIKDINEIPLPEILIETDLKCESKVTTVHWVATDKNQFIILLGYFDGRIHGLRISKCKSSLQLVSVEKYYDIPDRLAVNDVVTFVGNSGDVKALVCKGSFVFLILITKKGLLKNVQHLKVKGFSISGMCTLENECVLLVTENGLMWKLDVHGNQFLLTEVNNTLNGNLPRAKSRFLGLTHSTNRALFLTATSPNSIYDHLIMKEPSKINFFGFTSEQWSPSVMLKNLKDVPFCQLWDCLELLRIKAIKLQEPDEVFPKTLTNYTPESLNGLRLSMWIAVLQDVCLRKQPVRDFGCLDDEISELQSAIITITACDYLELLKTKISLTEEETTSINSLLMYLEIYLAGEENEDISPVCKRARETYDKISGLSSSKLESCNICGKHIKGVPWKAHTCPDGHILPRCAITFLQVTGIRYKFCSICNQIFHPCLDKMKDGTRCLFCDVPAVFDDRVLNLRSLREKSLSKPQGGLAVTVGTENDVEQMD